MNEDFLQYVWANSLFTTKELVSVSGRKVKVVDPGRPNRDAGPDFFFARLRIDDMEWAGNVEIHTRNSDWYRHGHQKDAAYDNVILSVVCHADTKIFNSRNLEVETVVLDGIERFYEEYLYLMKEKQTPRCRRKLSCVDDTYIQMALQSLAVERLERKCEMFRALLIEQHFDWEECFYRLLCKYWAGNVNTEPFYQLSRLLPYRLLLRYTDNKLAMETLLLGCAGLLENVPEDEYTKQLVKEFNYLKSKHQLPVMNPCQWKFMRIRPEAFPTIRLALLAEFLDKCRQLPSQVLEAKNLKEVYELLDVSVSGYWTKHFRLGFPTTSLMKGIGEGMKRILLINAVIPFMFTYGKERGEEQYCEKAFDWLQTCPPEYNYIIKEWKELGIGVDSALASQALIQLTREYCEPKRCLQCRIALEVLKRSGE